MSVIGFDIGNVNCVIAAAKRGGIDVLLNDEAKRESPAVVSFGDKQRFLGSAGAAFATANPKSTISQIKRLIGRQYKEPSVQEELKLLPFVTSEGPRGGIMIELEYMKEKLMFAPVEILGMLFKHLKQIAEKNLESPVADCVIGIPSYFTDLQRREYLDAATVAGLKPLRLMHDGTATALGYGMYKSDLSDKEPTIVVFVDIGNCDTQVTLAAFEQGKMKILSHTFDQNLGGRDFDELLFQHFAAQFKEQYKVDVHSNARASIRLRTSCEKLKKVLSANTEAPLSIECLIEDTDVRGIITREEFDNLSQELLERITVPCIKAVNDSGISPDKIYTIELVGSGSRIPAIVKKLTSLFKKEPTRTLNASECVARGCALRCAMLSPTLQVQPYKVQDFFPYSIGLSIDEGQNKALFPKGISFPANIKITYHGTTPLNVQVFYTNKKDFPAIKLPKVGHFMIGAPESSGEEKVRTEFKVLLNKHGIVALDSAIILEDKNAYSYLQKMMGNNHTTKLPFSENLVVATTEDELRQAQKREWSLAEQDTKVEQIKDQRNTLESFVYDTRNKLSSAYRSFATDTEKDGIIKSLQETEDWLYEDSDDESVEPDYTVKLEDLKKLLDPIEKRYKYNIAIAKETKAMTARIEKYRSATELMPLRQKDEVNNQCLEAEKWLIRYQQHEGFKNIDPIRWSSVIQESIEKFEWNIKVIMTSKPSSPKHEPVDTDQRDQCVDQTDHLGDQTDHLVDSTHMGLNQRNQTQRDKPVYSNSRDRLMGSNQREQTMGLNQRNQTMGSNQREQTIRLNQRDRTMGSNQSDQAMGMNQRDWTMGSNQRYQTVGSNQREQTVGSNQRGKIAGSNQGGQIAGSNLRGKIAGSNQGGQTVGLIQMDQTMGSNQRFPTVGSHQSDETIGSNQRHRTLGSYISEHPLNPDKKEQPMKSNQRDQLVNSDTKDQPVNLDIKDHPMNSDIKDHPVNSDIKDQSVNSDFKDQPVNSDIKDQPVSSDQRDQPQDSDQRDQQDYMEE